MWMNDLLLDSIQFFPGGEGTMSVEDKSKMMLDDILEKLPDAYDMIELEDKLAGEDRTPFTNVFLQEIEVTRRASKELATGPSVNFTTEPPHELKTITSLTPKTGQHFIGFVSLAVSKRNVEGPGKLEKAVGLSEAYRAYLVFHVKACKSQIGRAHV